MNALQSPRPALSMESEKSRRLDDGISLITRYYLADYEENRYHDSYFRLMLWNDETGEIETPMWGATAFGGIDAKENPAFKGVEFGPLPPAIASKVRRHYFAKYVEIMRGAETACVMEPSAETLVKGCRVKLLKNSRKGAKFTYRAGEAGTVFWQGWHGTFYRNGYNTKGRHNGQVGIQLDSGEKIFCAMTVCRLEREISFEGLKKRAARASRDCPPCPHAWHSSVSKSYGGRGFQG